LIIFDNPFHPKNDLITGEAVSTSNPVSWLIILVVVLGIAILALLMIFLLKNKKSGNNENKQSTPNLNPSDSRMAAINYSQHKTQQSIQKFKKEEPVIQEKYVEKQIIEPEEPVETPIQRTTPQEPVSQPHPEATTMLYPRKALAEPPEDEENEEDNPDTESTDETKEEIEEIEPEQVDAHEEVKKMVKVSRKINKPVVKKIVKKPVQKIISKKIKKTTLKPVKKKVQVTKKEPDKDIIIPVEDESEEKPKKEEKQEKNKSKKTDDADDMFKDISEVSPDEKIVVEKD